MPHRGARGFTLTELLVVIAIMVTLMGLLFPVARKAKESLDRNTCFTNLRAIAQGVQIYNQDHDGQYPPMPGYVGRGGVPTGGVTGLALDTPNISRKDLWCSLDLYPSQEPGLVQSNSARDERGSTYAFGYNYYGYVQDVNGRPFPITTQEAAVYLMGDPARALKERGSVLDPKSNWDLDLLRTGAPDNVAPSPDTRTADLRPAGLYQGLWNYRAPGQTIVSFCTHHPADPSHELAVVTLSGEARTIDYARSVNESGDTLFMSGSLDRKPDPTARPRLKPGIDWRTNRGPYTVKDGKVLESASLIGDAPFDAARMPVVETHYAFFSAADLQLAPSPDGYGWYDTGIEVAEGDLVMVVANARWTWDARNDRTLVPGSPALNPAFANPSYAQLFDASNRLWFTAQGDPTEEKQTGNSSMLLAGKPHCLLVGYLGSIAAPIDRTKVRPLGSRGSIVVAPDVLPAGTTAPTLHLSLNDTTPGDISHYKDDLGWCEVWVAICRARDANAPLTAKP